MDDMTEPAKPVIEVELLSDELAIVRIQGEHDLSTKKDLTGALEAACNRPRVLVDLTGCTFLDSTALAVLLSAHGRQIERDGRFEIVIPRDAHSVQRLVKLTRVDTLLTIHDAPDAGLASLKTQPDAT